MTVAELIAELQKCPPEAFVFHATEGREPGDPATVPDVHLSSGYVEEVWGGWYVHQSGNIDEVRVPVVYL